MTSSGIAMVNLELIPECTKHKAGDTLHVIPAVLKHTNSSAKVLFYQRLSLTLQLMTNGILAVLSLLLHLTISIILFPL